MPERLSCPALTPPGPEQMPANSQSAFGGHYGAQAGITGQRLAPRHSLSPGSQNVIARTDSVFDSHCFTVR
jgi:hypothetical protein